MQRALVIFLLSLSLCTLSNAENPGWLAPTSDAADLALPSLDAAVPDPRQELGYSLGSRFSPHGEILHYLRSLAAASDRVTLWEYGTTYEGRPLVLMAISSPENLQRLEELRTLHLQSNAAGNEGNTPVFTWLAYGIHGNEAASTEAAMATAFVLTAANDEFAEILQRTVVLLDPLSNPDGHERYVQFFTATSGTRPDSHAGSAEHLEPWPGGRQNHYLIDLNRDWAWVTQRETRARLAEYRRWEPHVYVDFHEMWAESTYFFPPPAEPIHPEVGDNTRLWLNTFGRANAAAFDRLGWLYYVRENFDLFYPGYGDAYPSLRGAVGMTYEVGGHARAGLALERKDGSLLTLADRIARHLTSGLTTIRTAAANRAQLDRDYRADRQSVSDRQVRTYLWSAATAEAAGAAELLALHGVEVRRLSEETNVRARPLTSDETVQRDFAAGTFFVSTDGALAPLVKTLMEREIPMGTAYVSEQRRRVDQNLRPEFFDITAWSIPMAFNLEAWVHSGSLDGKAVDGLSNPSLQGEGGFGYLIPPQGMAGYRMAGKLLRDGIKVRLALDGFELKGSSFPRGTLFVPANGNPEAIEAQFVDAPLAVHRVATGFADSGVSLGSNSLVPLRRPEIGLVGGNGVDPTSFGAIWHLLDRQIEAPYHRLALDSLPLAELHEFDILILPNGSGYGRRLSKQDADRLARWVEDGGILLAIGGAIDWLREQEMTTATKWKPEEKKAKANEVEQVTPAHRNLYTPGAAVAGRINEHHPLTVGFDRPPAYLFRGSTIQLPFSNPRQNVVVADPESSVLAGLAWAESEERLRGALLVGVEKRGRGALVLFAQEPVFRLFWRASAPPFLNAVLYGPSLHEHRRLVN